MLFVAMIFSIFGLPNQILKIKLANAISSSNVNSNSPQWKLHTSISSSPCSLTVMPA